MHSEKERAFNFLSFPGFELLHVSMPSVLIICLHIAAIHVRHAEVKIVTEMGTDADADATCTHVGRLHSSQAIITGDSFSGKKCATGEDRNQLNFKPSSDVMIR